MVRKRDEIKLVQFRAQDQLHGLAASFEHMQKAHKFRDRRIADDLSNAEKILEECEQSLEEGREAPAELESKISSLREIYQAAKNKLSAKTTP